VDLNDELKHMVVLRYTIVRLDNIRLGNLNETA